MVQPLSELPKEQVTAFFKQKWGSSLMASKGRVHHLEQLPGLAVVSEEQITGLLTYQIAGGECEIVTVNSTVRGQGTAALMLDELQHIAAAKGCTRMWCIVTNDNIHAIRFFQKNGMTLCSFYRNALEDNRRLKPQIPMTGQDGIPIEHELELEKRLQG
ncbi:GNAT family N-acetyltransferase [Paenibacillus pinistramenti]|uniref:GNAT family N-acetyltransferase n=1 Tax=Paenibacillus pinistramenti TaxID=1768003 RepID=UPI0011098597|nr:GNAT family N-acetyltransferase [Paenibacillus pinistramenti]